MLENFITELLLKNKQVIIPSFGLFKIIKHSSFFNLVTERIKPPLYRLEFYSDHLLEDDGLLAVYISQKQKVNYEEALIIISKNVDLWINSLKISNELSLTNIGTLKYNKNSILTMVESTDYILDNSFGLPIVDTQTIKETFNKRKTWFS